MNMEKNYNEIPVLNPENDVALFLFASKAEEYLLMDLSIRSNGWYAWRHFSITSNIDSMEVKVSAEESEYSELSKFAKTLETQMRSLLLKNALCSNWAEQEFEAVRERLQNDTVDEDVVRLLDETVNPFEVQLPNNAIAA